MCGRRGGVPPYNARADDGGRFPHVIWRAIDPATHYPSSNADACCARYRRLHSSARPSFSTMR